MNGSVKDFVLELLTGKMNLKIDTESVTMETTLNSPLLKLESLSLIEVCVNLESQYGIKVPDEDFETILNLSFAGLENYVSERLVNA